MASPAPVSLLDESEMDLHALSFDDHEGGFNSFVNIGDIGVGIQGGDDFGYVEMMKEMTESGKSHDEDPLESFVSALPLVSGERGGVARGRGRGEEREGAGRQRGGGEAARGLERGRGGRGGRGRGGPEREAEKGHREGGVDWREVEGTGEEEEWEGCTLEEVRCLKRQERPSRALSPPPRALSPPSRPLFSSSSCSFSSFSSSFSSSSCSLSSFACSFSSSSYSIFFNKPK